MVGSGGFGPPNPKEQIYSLPRLTTSLTAHRIRSYIPPNVQKWWMLRDSNPWPPPCKGDALTSWAKHPPNFSALIFYQSTLLLSREFLKAIQNRLQNPLTNEFFRITYRYIQAFLRAWTCSSCRFRHLAGWTDWRSEGRQRMRRHGRRSSRGCPCCSYPS